MAESEGRFASSSPRPAEFFGWPTERVARWVEGRPHPVVMGWPFNGTRRWYMGEMARRAEEPDARDYVRVLIRRQAGLHRMIFAHGVAVILAPGFGTELLGRGPEYTRLVLGGLLRLANDEIYAQMFAGGLRLRFYGDYEGALSDPSFRPMLDACARLTAATASGEGPLLLIGLFADAPYSRIARLSVEFADAHGRPPDRAELIEAYYGVPVPDLSLYVGYARPEMFDVPLLATGEEHLYATLNPSPDLTERQLREILYDHLVARRAPEVDYEALSPEAREALIEYNRRCSGATLGLGRVDPTTGMWRPVFPDVPEPTGDA